MKIVTLSENTILKTTQYDCRLLSRAGIVIVMLLRNSVTPKATIRLIFGGTKASLGVVDIGHVVVDGVAGVHTHAMA